MALFIHLKIISLQCFQFSIFNNKQYPNKPQMKKKIYIYIFSVVWIIYLFFRNLILTTFDKYIKLTPKYVKCI